MEKGECKNTVRVDENGSKHYTMIAEPARFGVTFMGQKPEEGKSSPEPSDPTDNSVVIVSPE
jgi:hypothetical protein